MTHWEILASLTSAVVLVFAALGKSSDVTQFTNALRQYELIPEPLVGLGARVVVVGELVLAFALVSGAGGSATLWVTALLFASFAGVTARALLKGKDIDCGCFGGILQTKLSRSSVVANLGIAGLAATVALWPGSQATSVTALSYLAMGGCSLLLGATYVLSAYAASVRLRIAEITEEAAV